MPDDASKPAPAPERSGAPPAREAARPDPIFEPLGPLDIADGMNLRQVALRQRLRFAVPVRQPLVLISQIQRSGGTLVSQLLDGHSALHVHPGELHIGRPNKYLWPDIDLASAPADIFDRLRERVAITHARQGYQKLSGAELAENPGHGELLLPFIFSGELQGRLFARALGPRASSRRQVLDAYATSYFNAWLDYAGLYRRPETVRFWVGFVARLIAQPGQVERMFEDYPDGRMIIPLRDPESWLASARRHSAEYADTATALDLWEAAHARTLHIVSARPALARLVRFERLVGDTEACMRDVAAFLGIGFEPSLLEPTYNRIPIASNSSFGAGFGVDASSAARAAHLDEATRAAVRDRTARLYRKLGAIADYQRDRGA